MALASAIEWDVQTGGHIDNGGGFKAGSGGTDRSLSTTPHVTFDGATILAVTAGVSATITITGYTVISGDVGNVLNITGGTNFTTGRYEITSVNTGLNQWTLDRNCATGVGAAMTGRMGGCVDHPNTIESILVDGNFCHVKSGTYQKVGANTYVLRLTQDGSNSLPVRFVGYTSSHYDDCYLTDRPLLDGNSSATNCLTNNSVITNNIIFRNFRFASATSHGVITQACSFYNCKISNNGGKGYDGGSGYFISCEINNNSDIGVFTDDSFQTLALHKCYVHDNTNQGVSNNNGSTGHLWVSWTISESNTNDGFSSAAQSPNLYINTISYNNTGASSDGYVISGGGAYQSNIAINSISKDNGRYGFNRSSASVQRLIIINSCYHGNATAGTSNVDAAEIFDSITTDPLFVDPANGNFGFQWNSPCLNTGSLANLSRIGLSGNLYNNIGIDQNRNFFTWGAGTISKDATGGISSSPCMKFDPSSTTKELGYRFYIPCENAVDRVLKFQVKKSSSSANCTFTFSASGSGITPIANSSVTLTDTYAEYTSSVMTPTSDGFIEIILRATDGSTTGDVFVDDIVPEDD